MGEAERKILDPRSPVVVSAKISRAHADELFGQRTKLSEMLLEASTCCAALMVKLKVEEITFTLGELQEGRRLASHMQRSEFLDGLKLALVGQHESQGENGQEPPPEAESG